MMQLARTLGSGSCGSGSARDRAITHQGNCSARHHRTRTSSRATNTLADEDVASALSSSWPTDQPSEAVHTVVREEPADPFNVELTAMLAEMNLGATRRRALENLAERIPLDSLRAIIASVVQAEQLGTPLADVLHEQATLMRTHRSIRAEHEAAVASVRILLPCLLLVMAVVLAIFGPAIVQVVRGGLF